MKVTGKPNVACDLEVKRFYIPGVVLSGKCPNCKAKWWEDFGDSYLSYPTANKPFDHGCCCPECDHEWTVRLRIDLAVSVVDLENS
jgi:hypothetical protein